MVWNRKTAFDLYFYVSKIISYLRKMCLNFIIHERGISISRRFALWDWMWVWFGSGLRNQNLNKDSEPCTKTVANCCFHAAMELYGNTRVLMRKHANMCTLRGRIGNNMIYGMWYKMLMILLHAYAICLADTLDTLQLHIRMSFHLMYRNITYNEILKSINVGLAIPGVPSPRNVICIDRFYWEQEAPCGPKTVEDHFNCL